MELLTQVGYYIENHLYATIGATTLGISIIRLLVSAIIFGVREFLYHRLIASADLKRSVHLISSCLGSPLAAHLFALGPLHSETLRSENFKSLRGFSFTTLPRLAMESTSFILPSGFGMLTIIGLVTPTSHTRT
jgi:hypothetical protein